MTVEQIQAIEPKLEQFLGRFDGCFGRPEPAGHLDTFVRGQLSDLPRKSIEPIALAAGTPPRTLQQFFSRALWDEEQMRDQIQRHVAAEHAHPQAIGILDATSHPKKGDQTPGVGRQWCGARGKVDNCVSTVHLAYAAPDGFRVLLDGELFLPEDWAADPERRRKAGIPEHLTCRTKWQIALELLDRAAANGICLPWVTFDEDYGRKAFMEGLQARGQRFAGEVPSSFWAWSHRPAFYDRPDAAGRSADWLNKHAPATSTVQNLVRFSPAFRKQPWRAFEVRQAAQGPIVWEAKFAPLYLRGSDGRVIGPLWLVVARNVLDREDLKYIVSNAPPGCFGEAILGVGLGRYPVERCFEDDKTELGLDHFEVRNCLSLKRHLIVTGVSSLFLAETCRRGRGEKSAPDGLPGACRGQRNDHREVHARPTAAGIFAAAV